MLSFMLRGFWVVMRWSWRNRRDINANIMWVIAVVELGGHTSTNQPLALVKTTDLN